MTPTDENEPLERAWRAALRGRGGLVLVSDAGNDADGLTRALAALTASAMRSGTAVRRDLLDASPAEHAAGERFAASAAIAESLRTDARGRPLLAIVEHVESASLDSLRLLAFLGRELRESAVLIVAAREGVAASSDPERARVLADLARAGEWISVGGEDARAEPMSATPSGDASAPGDACTIARDGRMWVLMLGTRSVRLRDSRGMTYLARLIAEPGREHRAVDLAERAESDAGEALDAHARAVYRKRLAALGDVGGDESVFLERELSRGAGLGGRARRAGSEAERARVAVTRGIRRALARIAESDPALGRWLDARVRTGHVCSFAPEGD